MANRKKFDELKIEVSASGNIKATYDDFDGATFRESPPEVTIQLHEGQDKEINNDIKKLMRGTLHNEDLELLGEKLFRIIFAKDIREIFDDALNNIEKSEDKRGLRIVIEYPETSVIANWPLELLRRPGPGPIWLSTDERLSLSRKIHLGGTTRTRGRRPPLRILVVVSSPKNKYPVMNGLVLDSILKWAETVQSEEFVEEQNFQRRQVALTQGEEVVESALIEVKLLGKVPDYDRPSGKIYLDCNADYDNFREIISDWRPQILHFIGHGDVRNSQGRLAFVDSFTSNAQWINANDLQQLITAESSRLKLVLLQVCKSASAESRLNLASRMVSLKIPAVVAMQFEIDNYCAVGFASRFYQELARKSDVDYAVQLARHHITQLRDPEKKNPRFWNNREFCTPVIYTVKPATIIDFNSVDTNLDRTIRLPQNPTEKSLQTNPDLLANADMMKKTDQMNPLDSAIPLSEGGSKPEPGLPPRGRMPG
jgi:hypothetical protein